MAQSKQSRNREEAAYCLKMIEWAERDMRFFFGLRHKEGNDYAECRQKFYAAKKWRKKNLKWLAQETRRVCSNYEDSKKILNNG